jgi:hypothetical protein
LTEPGRLPGVRPVEGRDDDGRLGRVPAEGRPAPPEGREDTLGGRLMEGERPIEGEGRDMPPPP